MSQNMAILEHLKLYGSITPLEAFKHYGILACHSRMAELRGRGYKIDCHMIAVGPGKRVGCYSLRGRR